MTAKPEFSIPALNQQAVWTPQTGRLSADASVTKATKRVLAQREAYHRAGEFAAMPVFEDMDSARRGAPGQAFPPGIRAFRSTW